jgi:cytochrome c biogenesis protein CcdA
MINVAFHIVYHFLSRMPIGIYEHVIQNKSTKSELTLKAERFVLKFFRVFSIALMVISIIGIIFFLKTVFTEGRYESLFMITIFGAVFLGGYKSKLKLSEKLVPTET